MYKIIINKIETKTKKQRGQYTVIGERLITAEEYERAGWGNEDAEIRKAVTEATKNGHMPTVRIFDYPPEIETTELVDVKVLEQTVEELNLAEVICAINNLKDKGPGRL